MGDQISFGYAIGLDKGGHRLAIDLVRHADHGGVNHVVVADQGALHLLGIDVEAAREDHVLLAVGDIEIAVVVPMAQITGVQPTIPQGCRRVLRAVQIALHHGEGAGRAGADQNFADPAIRQILAGIVDDANLDPRRGPADGGGMGKLFLVGQRSDAAGFGHGEKRHQFGLRQQFDELLFQGHGEGLAGDQNPA